MPGNSTILLAHGDGGLLTRQLIDNLFLKYFNNPLLQQMSDAAVFTPGKGKLAMTTDSFVVNPIFFPGGDIGKLAVCGTVNDLAVSGARPQYLTASFIIEEGFSLEDLERITSSMANTCIEAGTTIVAGDTKVVPRGHADKIFINTTGIGTVPPGLSPGRAPQPGDKVIINGSLGKHGLTVLSAQEDLGLEGPLESDCAPLNNIISKIWDNCPKVKIMRDLTRGGLATAAREIAEGSEIDIRVKENSLPADPAVEGAAQILGLDPLYLANEGRFLVITAPGDAEKVLELLQESPYGPDPVIIGDVREGSGSVYLETALGGTKTLNLLAGNPLPRIC
ncbi:MAG: hydrogenase expression/formation protein HypE [Clostridiales bacterium]|nr:hydrogenase expression/formation protein HypE [Clostridiales bacterium]MCF8021805.1 hydrogenase expression/formation protein HypE [Clostridiales bacterium]